MSMFTNKRIMVVAAHPDDELLGLGATMHKLIKTDSGHHFGRGDYFTLRYP